MRICAPIMTAALLAGCASKPDAQTVETAPLVFEATASDGVRVYGYPYYGALGSDSLTILLFHQGGASARGEYAEIAAWLNSLGYRSIAWDLRKGGEVFEVPNQTVAGLSQEADTTFCAAYRDVEAALDYSTSELGLDSVVVWGSSYSGFIYQLAARHPDSVQALIAFSPASGGPVADCRAGLWADQVQIPAFVLRPANEMERDSSKVQRELLVESGAAYFISDPGTHGASMLIDARAGGDASQTRQAVMEWLGKTLTP